MTNHDSFRLSTFSYPEILSQRYYEKPKTYSFLPFTFVIKHRDPENFIPYRLEKHFNEISFYNMHRQCFNSCVDKTDVKECYNNCTSKHLSSIQIFKTALEEHRKWNPVTSYINLREFHKRPEEMGVNVPTDGNYYSKLEYLTTKFFENVWGKNTKGYNDLFDQALGTTNKSKQSTNIFNLYLNGLFPPYTKKAIERSNVTKRYEEYMNLMNEYGSKIEENLDSSKEYDVNWGNISGEDYEA